MVEIVGTGNLCPKKSGGKLSLKIKKIKKNTGPNLAYYVVCEDRGDKGGLWGAFLCEIVGLIHFIQWQVYILPTYSF